MKKKYRWIRTLFLLILIGGISYLGLFIYNDTDVFVIKDIVITGNLQVSDDEIIRHLLKGDVRYFNMNTYELNDKLEKHPMIEDGIVKKVFPDRLEVVVNERIPVIALEYTDHYLLIDKDLVVVGTTQEIPSYYIVRGFDFETFSVGKPISYEEQDRLESAIDLVYFILKKGDLGETSVMIEEGELVMYLDEFKVLYGTGYDIEKQFNSMLGMHEQVVGQGYTSGIMNLKFKGQNAFKPFGE